MCDAVRVREQDEVARRGARGSERAGDAAGPGEASARVDATGESEASGAGVTAEAPGPARPRLRALAAEFGKFGVVGALAYAVDVGAFNLGILALHWPDLAAKSASTVVAATLAFCGNRFWTWRDRPRSRLHREYALYFLFNAIGLGISLACLGVNHLLALRWPGVFGNAIAANLAANVVGVGLGTLFRFHAYRRWVFAKSSANSPAKPRP